MVTLLFLVCNTLSGECYPTTSGLIYKTDEECQQSAVEIIERVKEDQRLGLSPPEQAVYVCYNWGDPA
jgi:hypothetical protein